MCSLRKICDIKKYGFAICVSLIILQLWITTTNQPCFAEPEKKGQSPCQWNFIQPDDKIVFNEIQFLDRMTGFGLNSECLHMTKNGGLQWEKIYCVSKPDICSRLQNFQFVTADEGWLLKGWHTLLHTQDRGKTWEETDFHENTWTNLRFSDNQHGWLVGERISPNDVPDVRGAICATTDGGRNWTEVNTGISAKYQWRFRDIWPISSADIWVAGDFVLHSANGGKTWKQAAIDPVILYDLRNISIQFNDEGIGWVSRMPSDNFLFTEDRGVTWTVRELPRDIKFTDSLIFFNRNEAWLTSGDIYRSVDGGLNWEKLLDISLTRKVGQSYYLIHYLRSEKTVITTGNIGIGICTFP